MMDVCKLCLCAFVSAAVISEPTWAAAGIQIGTSGKSYASATLACEVHPTDGMSPVVQVGLYNPKRNSSGTISLNGSAVAVVSFFAPDARVWLINGRNTIAVALGRRVSDTYVFDATANEANICLPDTSGNTVIGELEYAASNNLYATTYATVASGCAVNPRSGQPEPFVNLFDNGDMLFDVSVNSVALTQLGGARQHAPIFLVPGWNVIAATNANLAIIDYYVRDGGDGSCALQ